MNGRLPLVGKPFFWDKYIMKLLLLFLFLNVTSAEQDQTNNIAKLETVSQSKTWHRLLHYKDHWYRLKKSSQVDKRLFFLSPEGKTNPLKELKATIAAFKRKEQPKHLNWHTQCAYPARKLFLERELEIKFPKVVCKDYEWWKKRINTQSVSIVFSSYFATNPASMFGHTLLKFNSEKSGPGKLTDFSLNFAADTQGDGGLAYIIGGIFGGYPGMFYTDPYYLKVNEYAQGESRDLWEYKLKLDSKEIDFLMAHIWELKTNTYFDYYFFDENCSYMLLKIVEVAKEDWDLSSGFFFYAMPIDTVKRLKKVDAISEVKYRPSYRKKMRGRIDLLNASQRKTLRNLIDDSSQLSSIQDKDILDAYSSYLQFKRFKFSQKPEIVKKLKKKVSKALVKRAKIGGISNFKIDDVVNKYKIFDPLESHPPFTLNIRAGYRSNDKEFSELKFRFALADLYNNDFGYPSYFELEGPFVSFRHLNDKKRIQIQEVNAVSILSLVPFSWITPNISWGVKAQLTQPNHYDADNSLIFNLEGYYGISFRPDSQNFHLYALSMLQGQAGSSLPKDHYTFLPGIRIGSIFRVGSFAKLLLDLRGQYSIIDLFRERMRYRAELGLSFYLRKNLELHLSQKEFSRIDSKKFINESSLNVAYFF